MRPMTARLILKGTKSQIKQYFAQWDREIRKQDKARDFLKARCRGRLKRCENQIRKSDPRFSLSTIDRDDLMSLRNLVNGPVPKILNFAGYEKKLKTLMRTLSPKTFSEYVDGTAICSPLGRRSGTTRLYLRRRSPFGNASSVNDLLVPFLKQTRGVLLYQEQLMIAVKQVADFSTKEAVALKNAFTKQAPEEIEKMRFAFVRGVARKHSKNIAEEIFNYLRRCGPHLRRYVMLCEGAEIAYTTAYLKTHYRTEWASS